MRNSKPMVDTNILVYAHNQDSPYFTQAKSVLADLINKDGFCVSSLILFEFFSVITNGRKTESPLSSETALCVIDDMIESKKIEVLHGDADFRFFHWLRNYIDTTKRYQIYDAYIAYAMFQNEITELYTKNTKDFKRFDFFKAVNPIEPAAPRSPLPAPRFIPYGRQTIDEKDVAAVCQVLRSDWLTTGPKVAEFEQALAEYVGASHAVAVSNGTAALHCTMSALGIGAGDEVIVPTMTFAATANCVVYQGGSPVFADVETDTLLIDPAKVEDKITPRTKAIIGVDYAGQPCDWDALRKIADRHGLALVADACHALGAEYKGRKVGTLADMTVFSFHPVKHITTGEGGMISTDNSDLAGRMKIFRNHGITTDHRQREQLGSWFYEMVELGYNYRITDFQCALGISQLRKLPDWIARRQEIAAMYDEALSGIPGIEPIGRRSDVRLTQRSIVPSFRNSPFSIHAYHLYVVRLDPKIATVNRATLFQALRSAGIGVNVHYIPVHLHPFYQSRMDTGPGMCPMAEAAYEMLISLPMYAGLSDANVESVIAVLKESMA